MSDKNAVVKLIWDDKGEKKEIILDQNIAVSIGRDKIRDIQLVDRQVSKLHAVVAWDKDNFTITDQKSSNGTFVNGKEINKPTTLKEGDRVLIGSTTLKFVSMSLSQVENVKTKIFERPTGNVALQETSKPKGDIEYMETKVFEQETPSAGKKPEAPSPQVKKEESFNKAPILKDDKVEAVPKEMGDGLKEISILVEGLSGLVEQLNTTRDTAQKLRDAQEKSKGRVVSTVSKLISVTADLEKIAGQAVQLDQQIRESGFLKLLSELSEKSSDVNLLVKLAEHSELIINLVKAISVQARELDKVKQSLTAGLADYTDV